MSTLFPCIDFNVYLHYRLCRQLFLGVFSELSLCVSVFVYMSPRFFPLSVTELDPNSSGKSGEREDKEKKEGERHERVKGIENPENMLE